MRPTFDAALIAHLKQRVVEHNEANPATKTKLGDLRKIYERNFRRANPGVRALQKVEQHLGDLAKAAAFEEDKHPRARGGEFSSKGEAPAAAISLPASAEEHRDLQSENAGYRALTSDALPDNSHEAKGAALRDVGSVAAAGGVIGGLALQKPGGRVARAAGTVGAKAGSRFGKVGSAIGRKVGEKTVDGASLGIRSLLRVKAGGPVATVARKAGAFGLLSLAGGYVLRSQIKDSMLDPAGVGRALDAFSHRTIEKAAQSAELGQARLALTEVLAKGGPAGGSIDTLQLWLEQGGGDTAEIAELAKGAPWGKAITRLFTTVAGAGGAAAGSAAGYGIARATETPEADDGTFDGKHPRDEKGRFSVKSNSGRAHRFAQVGGLLGGAAAAIATHRAVSRYNENINLGQHAALRSEYAEKLRVVRGFHATAAGKANTAARIEDLISPDGKDPRFDRFRKDLAAADSLTPATPSVVESHVRQVFQNHIAEVLKHHLDLEIPKGNGWVRLSAAARGEPVTRGVPPAKSEVFAALSRMHASGDGGKQFREMLKRLVDNKAKKTPFTAKDAKTLEDIRKSGEVAVSSVAQNLEAHSAKVKAAVKDLGEKADELAEAKTRLGTASFDQTARGPLEDDAGKAGLESAVAAATVDHDKAALAHAKALKATEKLRNNPTGVTHPISGDPIAPPSLATVALEQSRLKEAATKKALSVAEKIVGEENIASRDKYAGQIENEYRGAQLNMAAQMMASGLPRRSRAVAKHLSSLIDRANRTGKTLAEADLEHLPNQTALDTLNLITKKTTTDKAGVPRFVTPKSAGLTEVEANEIRARAPEITAAHANTQAKVEAAEKAHVTATSERNGALAQYNATMKALPPRQARQWVSPEFRADIARLTAEVATMSGEFAKSPSGSNLKGIYDKVAGDAVKHTKAAGHHTKAVGGKIVRDLFARDDPSDPRGWRVDYGKVIPALSFGATLATATREDGVKYAQQLLGTAEQREKAGKKKRNIVPDWHLDPTSGAGHFVLHIPDPQNTQDRAILLGQTFQNSRGETTPVTTGASFTVLKQQLAEREERRKRAEAKQTQPAAPGASAGASENMTRMHDDQRKLARAGVHALSNAQALQDIPTYAGGPTLAVRKADFKPEGDLAGTVSRADGAVSLTLKDKFGLKQSTPGGGSFHEALAALFSHEAKSQTARKKYAFLTGYQENGNKADGNASILRANDGFKGVNAAQALTALTTEIDHVSKTNAPVDEAQSRNLARAIGLVAHVKGISAADVAPLYGKIKSTAPTTSATSAAPPAAAASSAPKTSVTVPPAPAAPAIDISKPIAGREKSKWNQSIALKAAAELSDNVLEGMKVDAPSLRENMPVIITAMAEQLHSHGFTETEAVGTIAKVMNQLKGDPKYREAARSALTRADVDPGTHLWTNAFRAKVELEIEKKQRELGKSADHHPLDDLEELVKISMGDWVESLHPRAASGAAGAGEFVAGGGSAASAASSAHGHGGISPTARIASEATEAAGQVQRRISGGNSGGSATLPGQGAPDAPQAWYNPTRLGHEFGGALGYDSGMVGAHSVVGAVSGLVGDLLPEFKLPGAIGFVGTQAAGLVAGSYGSDAGAEAGEAVGSGAARLTTGRKVAGYLAPESHGLDSVLANAGGSTVGGLVGSNVGRGIGAFAGEALGGTLGSLAGPAGALVGGAALGYAGGKISEGIYDYFAGYDKPAVAKALNRFSVPKQRAPGG